MCVGAGGSANCRGAEDGPALRGKTPVEAFLQDLSNRIAQGSKRNPQMITMTLYARQQKRHRGKEQTFGLWEKARVG